MVYNLLHSKKLTNEIIIWLLLAENCCVILCCFMWHGKLLGWLGWMVCAVEVVRRYFVRGGGGGWNYSENFIFRLLKSSKWFEIRKTEKLPCEATLPEIIIWERIFFRSKDVPKAKEKWWDFNGTLHIMNNWTECRKVVRIIWMVFKKRYKKYLSEITLIYCYVRHVTINVL